MDEENRPRDNGEVPRRPKGRSTGHGSNPFPYPLPFYLDPPDP